MFAFQRVRNVVIANSTFYGNNAGRSSNSAKTAQDASGGAISVASIGNLTLRNSDFSNNSGGNGGALMLGGNGRLGSVFRIVNGSFFGNQAEAYGGAIAILVRSLLQIIRNKQNKLWLRKERHLK